MAYQILHTTSLSDYYPESYEGLTITSCYELISQLIETELSPQAAFLLAEPVERAKDNVITWHTPLEGDIKKYQDLSPDEKDKAEETLCLFAGEYAAYGTKLLISSSEQRKLAGKFVSRLATSIAYVIADIPGAEMLFMVGDKPVLAAWGLSPVSGSYGANLSHALTEEEYKNVQRILAGSRPIPIVPIPLGQPEAISDPEPVAINNNPFPPPMPITGEVYKLFEYEEERDKSGILWLIITALATLLFFLLLAFLFLPNKIMERKEYSDYPLVASNEDERKEATLRKELNALMGLYLNNLASCKVQKEVPIVDPPIIETPIVEPPKIQEELIIPEDTQNLAFLEGCWVSDAGLTELISGLPVTYKYCFDTTGKAKVTVEQFDKDGNFKDSCHAEGNATIEGTTLMINDTGPHCPDSKSRYVPTTVVCSQETTGGAASCNLQSVGGIPLESMFTYAGKE
jgi:hypothetical protein